MDFTIEQDDAVASFIEDVQNTVIRLAAPDKVGIAGWAVDRPEFYAPLCDMIAEFCANRGVDLRYPCHETVYGASGECEEAIHDTTPPTDLKEREKWELEYDAYKGGEDDRRTDR